MSASQTSREETLWTKHSPRGALSVEPTDHTGQFWIEGMSHGVSFDDRYVHFSGYFGNYSPYLFAAAPDMLEALRLAHDYLAGNGWEGDPRLRPITAAIDRAEGRS